MHVSTSSMRETKSYNNTVLKTHFSTKVCLFYLERYNPETDDSCLSIY